MTQPIDLYFWPTPNGTKISIFLEEASLPYTVHYVNIGKGEQFAPIFLAISPNNRIPSIVDPDGPGDEPVSVFESAAILQYLGRKTGQFYPDDERARTKTDEWLAWQVAGFGPMLGQLHHFHYYGPERIAYAMDRYAKEARRLYGVLNTQLSQNEFVAGAELTIADMAIIPWAVLWARHFVNDDELEHFHRWRSSLAARPGVQRGLALGADKKINLETDEDAKKVLFGGTK